MAQLTSLIWSFLQVQTYLMPKRVSMKVKCLFQSSIYTIRISHSTLLIISYALPKQRPAPSLTNSIACRTLSIHFTLPDFSLGEAFSSKTAAFGCMSCAKRGEKRFLDSISSMKSRSLVFLLRSLPYSRQCCYLYMAIQVYSSPSLRLLMQTLTSVKYRSGKAINILLKSSDDLMVLLAEEGNSSARAAVKEAMNLPRYRYSISCSLKISGLLLCTNIAFYAERLPVLQGASQFIHHTRIKLALS